MSLTIKKIPEMEFYLGPSGILKAYQCAPAVSDYATGGYLITPQQVGMSKIIGATQLGQEYNSSGAVDWKTSLPAAAYSNPPAEGSTTGIYLAAYQAPGSAGNLTEVSANTDVSAYPVWLLFLGY